jgi:hypothetical protein
MATKTTQSSNATDENEVAATSSDASAADAVTTTSDGDTSMASNPVQAAFMITLDEFMQKLSLRELKRVELVNGFHYTERKLGTVKDYESNFQARFVAFTQLVIED